jgi:hypothetical protein
LADTIGVTKGFLSRVETWKSRPSQGVISRLIAATNGAVAEGDFVPPHKRPSSID